MFSIIKSGMSSAMHELAVISNNISNANSNGFKKSLVAFSDFAGGLLPDAVESTSSGMGSFVDETRISDGQGAVLSTENITDMALIGNGFFALQNVNDNSVSFTRNGSFGIDEDGFLTTGDNHRVLGAPLVDGAFAPVAGGIETLFPIQIPASREDVVMSELKISDDGKISARYGEEDLTPISSLTLGIFSNPVGLKELEYTKDNGLVEGVTSILMDGLNKLEINKRPIHCTDAKRRTLYIKDENTWERNNEKAVSKTIDNVQNKHIQAIKQWESEHPNWIEDSEMTDHYLEMIKSTTNRIEKKDTTKIIGKLSKKIEVKEIKND